MIMMNLLNKNEDNNKDVGADHNNSNDASGANDQEHDIN